MAANTDNVRAGITGRVGVAALGTTMPTTSQATWGTTIKELGFISEDGITETNDSDTTEIPAWQNGQVVRRYISGSSTTFGFTAIETNYDVLSLFYPGSVITTASGETKVEIKTPMSAPKAFIFDVVDGTLANGTTPRVIRCVVPKAELTERGDITYSNGDPIGYEMTLTAYPDATGTVMYKYTNDPAAAVPA